MNRVSMIIVSAAIALFSTGVSAESWHYNTSTDKMSGKSTKKAYTRSTNSLHLGFPYSGSNYGHLEVRRHPQYGLDVIVSVDKGQILCGVYECKLKIKFDDGSVENFTMNPAADHSSDVVFAKYASWAINHLKNAHEVRIQVPMYNEGNQVLEFHTEDGLTWPPK